MRLKLIVAYDGSEFAGWQSQAEGTAAQDVLECAVARICEEKVTVHGAGRTDSGVHALGQCAHIEVPASRASMRPSEWVRALNGNLPPQIRVLRARMAPDSFHARFSAAGKVYRYAIWNRAVLPPLDRGRAWHVPHHLDIEALRRCVSQFRGRHDFAAFGANRGKPVLDTFRTIHRSEVRLRGGLIQIEFEGDGFLYRMARMMTAAAVRIAQGKESEDWITRALESGAKTKCTYVAPACGLCLLRVLY